MAEPIKNVAYKFPILLVDSLNSVDFKINPTIEAGDFKISIDFAPYVNLTTLPVVQPVGSDVVEINLSAAEMNGDKIVVRAKDISGNEWGQASAIFDLPSSDIPSDITSIKKNRRIAPCTVHCHTISRIIIRLYNSKVTRIIIEQYAIASITCG